MACTWRTLPSDCLQGCACAYDCPAGYRHHLVRAVRSEAADIRCKSYRTVGLQSNHYGREFEINERGLRQWQPSLRALWTVTSSRLMRIFSPSKLQMTR